MTPEEVVEYEGLVVDEDEAQELIQLFNNMTPEEKQRREEERQRKKEER